MTIYHLSDLDIVTVYDPARTRQAEYPSARHTTGTFGMTAAREIPVG